MDSATALERLRAIVIGRRNRSLHDGEHPNGNDAPHSLTSRALVLSEPRHLIDEPR
jgi:hypothetical protein